MVCVFVIFYCEVRIKPFFWIKFKLKNMEPKKFNCTVSERVILKASHIFLFLIFFLGTVTTNFKQNSCFLKQKILALFFLCINKKTKTKKLEKTKKIKNFYISSFFFSLFKKKSTKTKTTTTKSQQTKQEKNNNNNNKTYEDNQKKFNLWRN